MRVMADRHAVQDRRLISFAYMEAVVRDDKVALRCLRRDARSTAKALGELAYYLMETVVIPVENGIDTTDAWVEVDYRRRTDPAVAANLYRRGRYRRMAQGVTLWPRWRLRRTARHCVNMLCAAHILVYGRTEGVTYGEAVLGMVGYMRQGFLQSSGEESNS